MFNMDEQMQIAIAEFETKFSEKLSGLELNTAKWFYVRGRLDFMAEQISGRLV